MLEDKLLVWKLRHGDKEPLRRVYEKYKDDLLTIAASLLHDCSAAEDILHNVFVSFAKNAEQLQLYGSLRSYLITCVVDRVRDESRKKIYQVIELDHAGPVSSDSDRLEQPVIDSEESQLLTRTLSELPLQQREVIILSLQGGLKFREIAEMQDISIDAALGRYRHGLDKLRSLLGAELIK